MKPIIIEHAEVLVPMDEKNSALYDGYVVMNDGRISRVGTGLPPPLPGAQTVDARGCLVMPGLINTHHHFYQTLTRAFPAAVNSTLFSWLTTLYPVWEGLTADSMRLGSKVAMVELALSGVTTTVDHHYVFPESSEERLIDLQIQVALDLGLRFVATRGSMSLGQSAGGLPPDTVVQNEQLIMDDSRRLIAAYHDDDPFAMIQIALAPCSPFSVTPRLMEQTAELAADNGVRLHTHLAETRDELDYCRKHYACTPVELLERTGWLKNNCWVAHGIHFSDKEIAKLGSAGVGIAHCPTSNMRLGSGIAPVPALRAAGCPVGLAVDGSASNDSSDMRIEVRQSLLLGRLGAGADGFSPWTALELATTGGAKCLGRGEALGRISPGYAADVAVFDICDIAHSGAVDIVAGFVLCAPAGVKHLFVAGRQIIDEGDLLGMDLKCLRKEHSEESRRLSARVA